MDHEFTEKLVSLWPFGKTTFNWDDGKIGNTPIDEFEGFELMDRMNFYRWPGKGRHHANQ